MNRGISKTFQFIRHGETDWNKNSIFQGQNDVPLNTRGLLQANHRAKEMGFQALTEVFTSPLTRARQTAEVIAGSGSKTLSIVDVPDLMECKSETCGRYIYGLLGRQNMPSFTEVEGCIEEPIDFFARVRRGLEFVLKTTVDPRPLIVAHGGVCVAICMILDLEIIETDNCELINFRVEGEL